MKKTIIISLIIILLVLTTGFVILNNKSENKSLDAIKFKKEYEGLNNKLKSDGKSKHTKIDIIENNVIKYSTLDEIMDILEDGTGVIYFGFPECPWCRNAVPELLEAAKELKLDKIYYYNDMSIRDQKKLDDNGNVITTKEASEEYTKLMDKLSKYLGSYKGLNDESIKRLYVPTVVFVRDGEIVGVHTGTVESQTDPGELLNAKQKEELKNIYKENMEKVLNDSCSIKNSC